MCIERIKIPNRISIHLDRQHLPSFDRTDDDDGLEHRGSVDRRIEFVELQLIGERMVAYRYGCLAFLFDT